MSDFLVGVNLPWLDYGCDFGASAWRPDGGIARPDRHLRLREAFATLSSQGLRWVRWFLLCDGRSGLRLAGNGAPEGLDAAFFGDVDAGLALADDHGLQVMLVLMDFMWFQLAREVGGVQLHGKTSLVADPGHQQALLDRVIGPIFERYGHHPALWAWDLFNEPEWATRGRRSQGDVRPEVMQAFIARTAELARRHSPRPVTVGLASTRGLGLVQGTPLDFYQLHWYDSLEPYTPLDRPVSSLSLPLPVLLGEFPTAGSARTPLDILDAARRSGYSGALAWSLLATDTASDYSRSGPALALWNREGGRTNA